MNAQSSPVNSLTSVLNIPPIQSNVKTYNDQKYQIDIIFDNLQGNRFQLNLASLTSLEIDSDTRSWFIKAALTIKNPRNVFEQKITNSASSAEYYKFRNDGRDLVYIVIKPVVDNELLQNNVQLDDDMWKMAYTFCIYDRKEIAGETVDQKELKLYLWEFDYQILAETNLDWSTSDLLKVNAAYATDAERLVNTGDAMKDLITKGLKNYSEPVFSKSWDTGASKIFFTNFAKYTAQDALTYLLNKHVCKNTNDPAILNRTRYNKNWQLQSYTEIFNGATDQNKGVGKLHREIFTLSSQISENDGYVFNIKSPVLNSSNANKYNNHQDPVRSIISNFKITDMSALDNMYEMVTTPCYSNDLKNKQFNVDFNNNNITAVKNFIDTNYAKKIQVYAVPDTLLTLNKLKTDNLAINNVYSYGPDSISRLAESRNRVIFSALFFNSSINFTALGSLIRDAGTFITLNTRISGVTDEFANKTDGQWLVYRVVHRFTDTSYNNDVTAVRLHANEDISIKQDVI